MEITQAQKKWLNQRGGRTAKDVREDKYGYYVLFYSPQGNVKVPLPRI
jgi:hypothetical protein